MTKIEKIKQFLYNIEDISIGYSEINFIDLKKIDESQVGYSSDIYGNSLISGNDRNWQDGWIVIANDHMNNPIFVDCSNINMPIYSSEHGQGEWEKILIANSIDSFEKIISELKRLSKNRKTPNQIVENPLTENDVTYFYNNLENDCKEIDLWWWEVFFENET